MKASCVVYLSQFPWPRARERVKVYSRVFKGQSKKREWLEIVSVSGNFRRQWLPSLNVIPLIDLFTTTIVILAIFGQEVKLTKIKQLPHIFFSWIQHPIFSCVQPENISFLFWVQTERVSVSPYLVEKLQCSLFRNKSRLLNSVWSRVCLASECAFKLKNVHQVSAALSTRDWRLEFRGMLEVRN